MNRTTNNKHVPCMVDVRVLGGLVLVVMSFAQPFIYAAHGQEINGPRSLDDLFVAVPGPEAGHARPVPQAPATVDRQPISEQSPKKIDELFLTPPAEATVQPPHAPLGTTSAASAAVAADVKPTGMPVRLTGFYQNELAYTYGTPEHWSKFRNTLDLSATGRTQGGLPWKLGGRLAYDPIYDLTDYYNSAVREDQRPDAAVREAYLDIPAGNWDFRIGRQHIVWGEMVGLFFADVISAKDLREQALPEFDLLRIPQWAGRAEYFVGDFHAEAVWIPYMSYDDIGKPGAEFYPFTPPAGSSIAGEKRPVGLRDSGYGLRLSYLYKGWDLSGFYYSANDPAAAFIRLTPTLYQPIHERIYQWGATLGKDLGPMVLKAEAVYTMDKLFNVSRPTDSDGLVKQELLDYIVGLEWSFPEETRFNMQLYQRWFPNHDPDIGPESTESGFSLLYSTQAWHPRLESEMLFIRSLNRNDWLAQIKATWRFDGNWQLAFGADVFGGSSGGLFGRFGEKDRLYTEVRYSF